ncbi:enoyl-CoA hydratase/isomerase family protein [Ottowia thiooxydans]|uniref:enoyl-CoA hydratase/isomerase family protein n=1 Tax=Ottowia thiooxydans TaxID=219182 RepID=UPI00041271C2|nr:enoyl-CoA hydratase/isomerase family protein [Ottowia thiooxydans]
MTAYQNIVVDRRASIVVVTFNRPASMNALSPEMEMEMWDAISRADADPEIRAVVLTGAGSAFCSGYDISRGPGDDRPSLLGGNDLSNAELLKGWMNIDGGGLERLMRIWHISIPVITAINGWAMGAGFWYALASDITLASDKAVFAQPEVRHVSNTSFLFAALAGWKAAHRFGLTGDHMDAAEAYRLGIVNEVVPHDELMERACALAERIALVPEPSVRLNKAVTCSGLLAAGLQAGLALNAPLSALAHASNNDERLHLWETMRLKGMRAFVAQRDGPFRPEPFGPKSARTSLASAAENGAGDASK